jgi:hypothetical protein
MWPYGHATGSLPVQREIKLGDTDSGKEDSEPGAVSEEKEEPEPGDPDPREPTRKKRHGYNIDTFICNKHQRRPGAFKLHNCTKKYSLDLLASILHIDLL